MNGVHDMGGMQGFGPVLPEADEPVFHAPWEKRVFALVMATARWPIDTHRHALECIPPADYLRMSYFERWLTGFEALVVSHGVVSAQELSTGRADPAVPKAEPPFGPGAVPTILAAGFPSERLATAAPRFAVGDRVRARNLNPTGHTRLPRYVRGHTGVVVLYHGAHVLPDTNAHGAGKQPQPLYTVRFTARDLWGPEAGATDTLSLDLWESSLDPAGDDHGKNS